MNIIVLNGSPKGETSVTMQYVKYLQKQIAGHTFKTFNIALEIRGIENNPGKFDGIIDEVRQADGVLWAFPLYVCAVHSHYMRFIELISERSAQDAFRGKAAAALSTSIHFFDNTAHSYMRAVCDDLGMRYAGFFSAAMQELTQEQGRKKLACFAKTFIARIESNLPAQRLFAPVQADIPEYTPGPAGRKANNGGRKVLLITDAETTDSNLNRMAERLVSAFASPVETVRLAEANIRGGCLGCLKCGYDNKCVYGGTDDIRELYTVKIKNADIIVFAAALRGRFFSSRFKTFVDRRFLMTHQPQMAGKQIAYLVSGPLGQNHNVVEIMQAITEFDWANLAGIVTDESGNPAEIDGAIDGLAARLAELSRAGYVQPSTFLGVGGLKVFRDEIFCNLRFVFRGDHRFYKKHGVYDFPQKKIGMRMAAGFMSLLNRVPFIRKRMQNGMKEFMLMPFRSIVSDS